MSVNNSNRTAREQLENSYNMLRQKGINMNLGEARTLLSFREVGLSDQLKLTN